MAKKAQPAPVVAAAAVGPMAVAAGIPQIVVPAGSTLVVIVDVGEMTIPYTVAFAGRTLIKSLVDRAELVPVGTGTQFLNWAFAHTMKGWEHTIAVSVDGGPLQVLESRSEAKKDPDNSVGFAVIN